VRDQRHSRRARHAQIGHDAPVRITEAELVNAHRQDVQPGRQQIRRGPQDELQRRARRPQVVVGPHVVIAEPAGNAQALPRHLAPVEVRDEPLLEINAQHDGVRARRLTVVHGERLAHVQRIRLAVHGRHDGAHAAHAGAAEPAVRFNPVVVVEQRMPPGKPETERRHPVVRPLDQPVARRGGKFVDDDVPGAHRGLDAHRRRRAEARRKNDRQRTETSLEPAHNRLLYHNTAARVKAG